MRTYDGLPEFRPPPSGIALTIGNFDGVHRGHQRILDVARDVALHLHVPLVVMTFEPHPLAVLAPHRAPQRLVTAAEKQHLLAALGVDACIVLRTDSSLLSQPAEVFLENLHQSCRPRAIIEGPDFNFGKNRGGSIQTLRDYADRLGYSVHAVAALRSADLPDHRVIASSAIRAALHEGRIDVTSAMLGRLHRIVGTVVTGMGRGLQIGFPTANLDGIPQMLPQHAVYAAVAQLTDGQLRLAAVNIGPQPTFDQNAARVEAHLLDWSRSLVGQQLGLHLLHRLREPRRFDSVADLTAQIRQDVAAVQSVAPARAQVEQQHPIPL